jgi:hypothetical protein
MWDVVLSKIVLPSNVEVSKHLATMKNNTNGQVELSNYHCYCEK